MQNRVSYSLLGQGENCIGDHRGSGTAPTQGDLGRLPGGEPPVISAGAAEGTGPSKGSGSHACAQKRASCAECPREGGWDRWRGAICHERDIPAGSFRDFCELKTCFRKKK